jgi:hypothetical protein
VPDDTARVARAAFPAGNPYLTLRDRLGAVFCDADFGDRCRSAAGLPPWRM